MDLENFEIGKTFFASAGFRWLCTDKGTRTITAIMLDPKKDKSWFVGPPYAVDEVVFDEHDMRACYNNLEDELKSRSNSKQISSHPNFDSNNMFKMLKDRTSYHKKNILKRDRVSQSGEILHPYSAYKKDDGWYIKTFELFSKVYSEMHEDDFVKLAYSDETALKNRKILFNK